MYDVVRRVDASTWRRYRMVACWGTVWRLVLIPALMLFAAISLPLTKELKQVIAVECAMPAGAMPIVLAAHYKGSPAVAVVVVIATSLLSLVSIPLVVSLALTVLGIEV